MASADGLRRSVAGLSDVEFRERFGTEEACRKALFEMRWREGLACPACGHRGFCRLKTREVFQCNRCKRQVRLTALPDGLSVGRNLNLTGCPASLAKTYEVNRCIFGRTNVRTKVFSPHHVGYMCDDWSGNNRLL